MCSFIAHRKKNISFLCPQLSTVYCCRYIYETEQVLFLNCFYLVKHRYRLHLSFTHRVLVFQKASNSYKRNPLILCFVFNLERKIIENQLCYIRTRPSKRGQKRRDILRKKSNVFITKELFQVFYFSRRFIVHYSPDTIKS